MLLLDLSLGGNNITQIGATAIGKLLEVNSTITILYLSYIF